MRDSHARNAELNLEDVWHAGIRAININVPTAGSKDREYNG
ncbi:hypothetical protein ig2599ANME_2264 [groundwater metagenome]